MFMRWLPCLAMVAYTEPVLKDLGHLGLVATGQRWLHTEDVVTPERALFVGKEVKSVQMRISYGCGISMGLK